MPVNNSSEDSMLEWNEDIESDLSPSDFLNTVIFSRDWTVETLVSQIRVGNIDLNPAFQRRNAWSDDKRSLLIESLVMGVPIPQIVLAEHPERHKKYLILDGKQRLMTIMGFFHPEENRYWNKPRISKLDTVKELNGLDIHGMRENENLLRLLENSDMRTAIISNYSSDDVLYSIFYRINSGSVPLSSQELRQSLHPGEFTKFLIHSTSKRIPFHDIIRLPDDRSSDDKFRDVEMILHYYSFKYYFQNYRGNLKEFLDTSLANFNLKWESRSPQFVEDFELFKLVCTRLIELFGDAKLVARKAKSEGWETSFNKVIFDALVYFYSQNPADVTENLRSKFQYEYRRAFSDPLFRSSVESSTKNLHNYITRYGKFKEVFQNSFGFHYEEPNYDKNREN